MLANYGRKYLDKEFFITVYGKEHNGYEYQIINPLSKPLILWGKGQPLGCIQFGKLSNRDKTTIRSLTGDQFEGLINSDNFQLVLTNLHHIDVIFQIDNSSKDSAVVRPFESTTLNFSLGFKKNFTIKVIPKTNDIEIIDLFKNTEWDVNDYFCLKQRLEDIPKYSEYSWRDDKPVEVDDNDYSDSDYVTVSLKVSRDGNIQQDILLDNKEVIKKAEELFNNLNLLDK